MHKVIHKICERFKTLKNPVDELSQIKKMIPDLFF